MPHATILSTAASIGAASAGLVTVLGLTVTPARADWRICNQTNAKVDIAIAWKTPDSGFATRGWFTPAPCGGCATVWSGDLPQSDQPDWGTAYYFARSSQLGASWQGGTGFCINDNRRFELGSRFQGWANRSSCSGTGLAIRDFKQERVKLNDIHTTNLISPGAACSPTATAPAPPPPPPPAASSIRTGAWSGWVRKDRVEYRSRWIFDPKASNRLTAELEVHNLLSQVWHGNARSITCAGNQLSTDKNVDIAPGARRTVSFNTANCGNAAKPWFKPDIVEASTL